MHTAIFSKMLIVTSRTLGLWVFSITVWVISTGYFFFFPRRVIAGAGFYRTLFPENSRFYHIRCVWKQYHNFTHVYLDRLMLRDLNDIQYISKGLEHLGAAARNKTGGIILMSHMGNWEIASHLLRRDGYRLLLYVGIKYKEQMERLKKENLVSGGIQIVAVDQNGSAPLDILDGIQFLKSGGFISLTGDRIWNKKQRTVPVDFLGHRVDLPEAPYLISLMSGAPLYVFFSSRSGKRDFLFSVSTPIYVKAGSRKDRKEAIRLSAQRYADLLEQNLRRYPFEWYHFESFLGQRKN